MVQCHAEQEGVVLPHFFQAAAQREYEIELRVMLHEVAEVVEYLALDPPGLDLLVQADHFVHHQDEMILSQR